MPNHKGEQTRHNGFAIRDFRIKMNLSSAELAKMAGLSVNGLNNIETETRDTRPVTLYRLARALDVRVHSILRDPGYANGNGDDKT